MQTSAMSPAPAATGTQVPLHPLLAQRWSPRAFDPAHVVDDATLAALLEAARWAPSAMNAQPWRFVVGRRGDAVFDLVADTLLHSNRVWAPRASALVVAVAMTTVDGHEHPGATYDLGQAVAHLTVQAHAEGLHSHQMGGFDRPALAAALGLPPGATPVVVVAVGRLDDPGSLPTELRVRETTARRRLPLGEIAYADWGRPLDLAG